MKTATCPLCGSDKYHILFKAKDNRFGSPGEFTIVECNECGLRFTTPRPTEEELVLYYPDHYAPYQGRDVTKLKSHSRWQRIKEDIKKSPLGPLLIRLLYGHSRWMPNLPQGVKVLDFGCSTGTFLNSLKDRGWNLHGVDMSGKAVNYAKEVLGLNVIRGTLEEIDFPSNHFDVVFAWHVLEHLLNPLRTLKEINRILKPNGYFIFAVPNAASWEWRVFKNKWYDLDPPRHLFHYTSKTASLFLQKADFRIERIRYPANLLPVIGSIGCVLRERFGEIHVAIALINYPPHAGLIVKSLLLPLGYIPSLFKQSGRIIVVARPVK